MQSPKYLTISDLDEKSQQSEKSPKSNQDNEAWENVSMSDVDLQGMGDPYVNKFKNVLKEY